MINQYGYDTQKCYEAITDLQNFKITAYKKEYHKYLVYDIKNLLDKIYDNTRAILIWSEYNYYYHDYKKAVEMYEMKTKKELDLLLHLIIKYGIKELTTCINL